MTYNTRVYLHGATAAVISGAANAITLMVIDPVSFNVFQGGFVKLAVAAGISGLVSLAAYLKTHPLPDPDKDIDATEMAKQQIANIKKSADG